MSDVSIDGATRRLTRLRDGLPSAGADAVVVTHLPNIRYLTGFVGTAGALVVAPAAATLLVDFRYATAAAALPVVLGGGPIEVSIAEGNLDDAIVAAVRRIGGVRVGIEAAFLTVSRFNRLSRGLDAGTIVPTERMVESLRIVKDESEIGTLREAGRRLSVIARDLRRFLTPGRTERQIAGDIEAALRAAGFERPAFETIVASGANSALPHARPTVRPVQNGEGAVLDFGGVYDGYCVDLTRTLHVGERPAPLRRIFDAVAEARAAAIAAVRPGVRASDVDAAARDVLERHGLGAAFGHGTGHGLGLEIHEEPRVTKRGTAQPDSIVEAGMVFTIEPGAYVPGVGGVRIEDDVLVTGDGAELLTDVPIDL